MVIMTRAIGCPRRLPQPSKVAGPTITRTNPAATQSRTGFSTPADAFAPRCSPRAGRVGPISAPQATWRAFGRPLTEDDAPDEVHAQEPLHERARDEGNGGYRDIHP